MPLLERWLSAQMMVCLLENRSEAQRTRFCETASLCSIHASHSGLIATAQMALSAPALTLTPGDDIFCVLIRAS